MKNISNYIILTGISIVITHFRLVESRSIAVPVSSQSEKVDIPYSPEFLQLQFPGFNTQDNLGLEEIDGKNTDTETENGTNSDREGRNRTRIRYHIKKILLGLGIANGKNRAKYSTHKI